MANLGASLSQELFQGWFISFLVSPDKALRKATKSFFSDAFR